VVKRFKIAPGCGKGQARSASLDKVFKYLDNDSFELSEKGLYKDISMKKFTLIGLIGLAVGALALFGFKWFQRIRTASDYKN